MAKIPICLTVTHVATGVSVSLQKIKIASFKDTLDTKYNSEEVFRRMDPIMTYQGTTRNISFSFDIGSDTVENMKQAQDAIRQLMEFQYPVYDDAAATALSRPPLLRVKFANYIQAENGAGLLCAMKGMSYNPIDNFAIDRSPRIVNGNIVPIRISVSMELAVLHEATVGWQGDSFAGAAFLNVAAAEAEGAELLTAATVNNDGPGDDVPASSLDDDEWRPDADRILGYAGAGGVSMPGLGGTGSEFNNQ